MDHVPRQLSESQQEALRVLSRQVMSQLELRRQTRVLIESEERYRTLFEYAPDGILIADSDSNYIDTNASMCRMLDYGRDELVGLNAADIVVPDEVSHIGPALDAIKDGASYQREWRFRRKDGSVFPADVIATMMPDGNLLGMVRDVSARHEAVEALRVAEQQFQQAQKMEAIGRLAGGVAHDFNNLLTVILGYAELLLAELDPADSRLLEIAEIHKAGARAATLTRQLLAFSHKEIIEPTALDLNLVVTDVQAMLERLIGEDVHVVLRLEPGLGPLTADRGQIEQTVLNLAVNARDAMPRGGTLTIETASIELDDNYAKLHLAVKPGPYVALTISDTGTGMTPDVQARLFEPFFTTKEVGKGTGLGLASVHGIVTRCGGSVNVYSEVGKGTTFTVYFPRRDGPTVVVPPPPVARARAGAETILVVEDADGLREFARTLLVRQGYTVLIAANATEARQVFEQHPSIDLMLTDVVMPGASGPELAKQLLAERPALKVIYMSGYTEEAIAQHGVLQPGIAFLHKPFTADTLARKVREVCDRQT
jgi:two-component system, cell cycle sensor histidine kinase and response regulator CckA